MRSLTPKQRKMIPPPKMTTEQAEIFWNNLTYEQKTDFAKMYPKLMAGTLKLTQAKIDEKQNVTSIILEDKEKPPRPMKPFMKHFHPDPALSD